MRTLAQKYSEFKIETGLRDYYLAEAARLRTESTSRSGTGREAVAGASIEAFLDRTADYDRREAERE